MYQAAEDELNWDRRHDFDEVAVNGRKVSAEGAGVDQAIERPSCREVPDDVCGSRPQDKDDGPKATPEVSGSALNPNNWTSNNKRRAAQMHLHRTATQEGGTRGGP